ncbi:MAG: DNA adenine methylase, partial [Pseudomonadota bacterium]
MRATAARQGALVAEFPSTRYQGSKAKLADWIWEQIRALNFDTCLDAFGGTGAIAYRLKQAGKEVTYNDILTFNYYIGLALIESDEIRLSDGDIEWIIQEHDHITYPGSSLFGVGKDAIRGLSLIRLIPMFDRRPSLRFRPAIRLGSRA